MIKKFTDTLKNYTAIGTFIAILFAGYFYIDHWKADAVEVQRLRNDYEAYKFEQRHDVIEQRIWNI